MDIKDFKEKILDSDISREELASLLDHTSHRQPARRHGLLNTLFKGYVEGYAKPNLYRLILESVVVLACVTGVVILTYIGRVDGVISIVLLAFLLGFVLGKMR